MATRGGWDHQEVQLQEETDMSAICYCGIDIGLKGAVAFLGGVAGSIPFKASRLPLIASGKRQEVDTQALWRLIAEAHPNIENLMVVVEECSHHQPSQAAMRSQALSYGKVLGMLEQHGVRYVTVLPQKWQKDLIGAIPKGQTKISAAGKAKRLWPKMEFKGDGEVDAALLAEFGRKNNL